MILVDVGSGTPIVIVPGVQGRWEWMRPGVDALARRCRVVTFSLAGEPSSGAVFDQRAGFASYVQQVADAMDQAGLERAAICGVSFGGLIAAAFAATHPERVSSLVLVSPLPPSWAPDRRARLYLRAPRLLSPLFYVMSLRLYHEIAVAHDRFFEGVRAAVRHGWNVLRHRMSPRRMAQRLQALCRADLASQITRLTVRTLVITGEARLDRVVPPGRSREYLAICTNASCAELARTGHLGLITRPDTFARIVGDFVCGPAAEDEGPSRVSEALPDGPSTRLAPPGAAERAR